MGILYGSVTPSPTYGHLKNIFPIVDMPFGENVFLSNGVNILSIIVNIWKPFWGVGDHFQVLKVSGGTCTGKQNRAGGPLPGHQGARKDMYRKKMEVGDRLQVVKVSEGTRTGKLFSGWGTTSRSSRCQKGHVPEK